MTTGTPGHREYFMLHVQESVNLIIYLYAQTMGHRRMLYIFKFYVVKNIYISICIHRWDTGTQLQWRVTKMGRNDLRAWIDTAIVDHIRIDTAHYKRGLLMCH